MANQTRQLAALLGAEGLEVSIARTNAPYRPAWVGSIRGLRGLVHQIPYRRSLSKLAGDVQVMHVMANSGWAWFLLAAPAIGAALKKGVPVIVNYRGGLAREFLRESGKQVVALLRKVDALIVPSRFLQEVFAEHGVNARIIPNVVNLEVFGAPPAQPRNGSRPHVVITRNLETIYGIDTALRAAALLRAEFPGLRVSVAGSGPQREALEQLSASLGLANIVRFTGRLEVSDVVGLYHDADIALNPSRADNTPNSLLEAAAAGVPLVSTNVGGVPYLVEHGKSAWLVAVDAPDQMAAGIARVIRDRTLAEFLRENARALADGCSWPSVRPQWLDLYEQLASKNSRGAFAAASAS
ncbi:MAG: glycosyltransferase family 4 protein [Gammaproteobacteria bacterium]